MIIMKMCILVRALRACEEYIALDCCVIEPSFGRICGVFGREKVAITVKDPWNVNYCSVVFPLSSLSLLPLFNTITI